MKVGILSFHRADNYGALLQTYGICEIMKRKRCETQVIDYRCAAIEDSYRYRILPKLRKNVFRWSKSLLKNIRMIPELKACSEKCNAFREKYMNISAAVNSAEDHAHIETEYDVIITGSDQIWNPSLTSGFDNWYAFQREVNDKFILSSYGASVGNIDCFDKFYEQYREALLSYDFLSVREEETRVYLQKKLDRSVFKVLDPTLLLPEEYWTDLQSKAEKTINRAYVLYYDVAYNIDAHKIADLIAASEHLMLVHFCADIKRKKNTLYAQNMGPIEFLALIKNAKYIVTSSFHATVFSVLFQKQFVVVPHPQTGVRVRNLMYDLELDERICEAYRDFKLSLIDKEINYKRAFSLLDDLKKESLDYIDMVLESARERTGMNEN